MRSEQPVLRQRNIRRGAAATYTGFLLALAVLVGPMAASVAASPIAAAQDETQAARLPDAGGVVAGYVTLREWIDAFELPRDTDAASRVPMRGATAVCVILRRGGRVLGVGIDTTSDELMLRRAAGRAMNQVLGNPALASLSSQILKNNVNHSDAALTVESLRRDLGRSLVVELEVAGILTPLIGRGIPQIAGKIEPGLDGLALRMGDRWQFIFPAHARATNTGGDPHKLLLSLALDADVPLKELTTLSQQPDAGLYTFRTTHLVQNTPTGLPFQTLRGDVLVERSSINQASITKFADDLARHVLTTLWPDPPADETGAMPVTQRQPLGVMGDYRVVADKHDPIVAGPFDQALMAFALHRYAGAPGVDADLAASARQAAATILRDLDAVVDGEADPRDDPVACAAIVYAISAHDELMHDQTIERLFNAAAQRVAESFDPAGGFTAKPAAPGERASNISPHGQAVIAGGMARLLTLKNSKSTAIDPMWVRKAIDAAWQSLPEPQRVGLLPWIGWAEADYASATGKPLARVEELTRILESLDDSRIGSIVRPGPLELEGGFALTSDGTDQGSRTLATAQSVRPAAWIATVLRDKRLVPKHAAAAALGRHLRTIRFLIQLSVRESALGMLSNPTRALGGVREALWDSDQPAPAQALALITAAETLHALQTDF